MLLYILTASCFSGVKENLTFPSTADSAMFSNSKLLVFNILAISVKVVLGLISPGLTYCLI